MNEVHTLTGSETTVKLRYDSVALFEFESTFQSIEFSVGAATRPIESS